MLPKTAGDFCHHLCHYVHDTGHRSFVQGGGDQGRKGRRPLSLLGFAPLLQHCEAIVGRTMTCQPLSNRVPRSQIRLATVTLTTHGVDWKAVARDTPPKHRTDLSNRLRHSKLSCALPH